MMRLGRNFGAGSSTLGREALVSPLLGPKVPGDDTSWRRYMDRPVDANEADARSATVTEAIYTRLRTDILLGEWQPDDRLKLDRLRQRYEASVNTLREALSRLVSEGLVANEGQRGFKVVGASLGDLQDITEMRAM